MGKIIRPLGSLEKGATKNQVIDLANQHAQQIIEQGYDLLKVYVELKRYDLYLNTIIKAIKEETLAKAMEEGKKNFDYANANITIGKRTKYNYEGDQKWKNLNEEIERLKALKKDREAKLKQIQGEKIEYVDQETGEVDTLIAPLKEMINNIIIKL